MLGLVPSASLLGVDGHAVTVEVHSAAGLPSFTVVGLPDVSCREARDRVRAAISSSGLKWPDTRVTVNLAPPTVRKVGSGLDLAIAVALLVASDQLGQEQVDGRAFLGELGLDGAVRPVAGTVCLSEALGDRALVLPAASVDEARLVGDRPLHPVRTLGEVIAAARGDQPWPSPGPVGAIEAPPPPPDLADVRGQPIARFALEVAAAGGHHLLMLGPPGAGKTMLASRLPGLLPPLSPSEALEEGVVRVARAVATVSFPARFLLVAAMNPCPCGYGSRPGGCRCTDGARRRYQRRLSGPLLDRFDLRVEVSRPRIEDLMGRTAGEPSSQVAERVLAARQVARGRGVPSTSQLPAKRLDEVAPLSDAGSDLLEGALRSGRLSARGLHRVRRVARTIADLAGCAGPLDAAHVATALSLRTDPPGMEPTHPALAG